MAVKSKEKKAEEAGTGTKITAENFLLAADNTEGKRQRRLIFKKRRGGVVLTREQVKAIKLGKKHLRKEMKSRGIKSKEEFNLMASSMGLYFDKHRALLFWKWLFHGRGLWALIGSIIALLAALFLYSTITQMRGHFTINMSEGMFREGFVLSETKGFEQPTTHLFAQPAEEVPCISISHIPDNIDAIDGQHNDSYFAYTYYVRNEGQSTVGYDWSLDLNSESLELSSAAWVMIFVDGKMQFYAAPSASGGPEALPAFDDNSRGYIEPPLIQFNSTPAKQYREIATLGSLTYYRVVPNPFLSDTCVTRGSQDGMEPQEVHKYTVVIWLEGDDPDCDDDLIGGHVGMEVSMKLKSEESDTDDAENSWQSRWDAFWDNLKFWQN